MCRDGAATHGRISTALNIYSVAKYYFGVRDWLYRAVFIFYIKRKVYVVHISVYMYTRTPAHRHENLARVTRADTGDYGGLSPWGAIPRCSMTVTIVSALFALENVRAIV